MFEHLFSKSNLEWEILASFYTNRPSVNL